MCAHSEIQLALNAAASTKLIHHENEVPTEPGWYECWAVDDRWNGESRYRAYGNGIWWIPLSDGWISNPGKEYKWRGPVADVNGPSPDGVNPVPKAPKE